MTSTMAKNMERKIYDLINCLADNYGFDTDEAFEFVRGETDVDHVGEILKMIAVEEKVKPKAEPKKEEVKDDQSEAPTESSAGGDIAEKIATCKKNIALWQAKLDKGSCKDADKQREKITKEKAKLSKLEAKAPVEKPAPAPAEKPAEKEKRIKRFSPVMSSQLKKALEDVGVEMSDKLKKEFQQYIEDLTDDDFRATGLADHMRAFAKLKNSAVAPPTKVTEKAPESEDEAEKVMKEIDTLTTAAAETGTPDVKEISIDELKAISTTAEMETPGTYWDADNGRFVKGPESDADEDVVEVKFNSKDYVVGEKTGRVYEVRESGDVFAGFVGVGKFKAMTM